MFCADRRPDSFGKDDRGAVTVDYVIIAAAILVLTIGFSAPLIEAVSDVMQDLTAVFAAAPTMDAEDWPSGD